MNLAVGLRPDEVCLVPEKREEITTEGGLDVRRGLASLTRTVGQLRAAGIRVSMFIEPDADQVRAAADVGADCVELHTGRYANAAAEPGGELQSLMTAAALAHDRGMQVNAGHGLGYANTAAVLGLPHLDTLNIGHAIVSRAIFVGLEQAVREMVQVIRTP